MAYQVIGTLGKWAIKKSFYSAVQDFRIGLSCMVWQAIARKTPKGVMSYAPVDVSYRSLERWSTPP